jgi:hypothetical protein
MSATKRRSSKGTKFGWTNKNKKWGFKYKLSSKGWSTSEKTPWTTKSESVRYPW